MYQLTLKHSVELFQAHIGDILEGNYTLTPQESLHAARGTAYHHREDIESLKKIDLNWDKEKIERHIRATFFPPFEPPYCIIEGKKFYFNA
ncbi:MAG: hypothetical protein IPL35_05435 [Sphingobacteriales bacterium]|nr:hypothetical protein [Sphingobacteriales bacterium]